MTDDNDTEFTRQNQHKHPRLKDTWRRPRGHHSKRRLHKKGQPPMPGIGHRSPKENRGKHPSGRVEHHVTNNTELEHAIEHSEEEPVAIRLSSTLSTRKKKQFIEHAHEENVPVLNIPQTLKPVFNK